MSEENKYLKLAKAAREEENTEDAKKYYEMAYTDMPDNPEAKWYYAYYSLMDCVNKEIADRYSKLCNSLIPTLKLVKGMSDEQEKADLAETIVDSWLPLKHSMVRAILNVEVNGQMVLPYSDVTQVKRDGDKILETLGDDILSIFGEKKPYTDIAVRIWKERIDDRHALSGYRNYKDKGKKLWFDELAERIQKYDSTYVMPEFKQAGGCAAGDAAKAQPGK